MIEEPKPRVSLTSLCPCGSGRKYKRCCWAAEKRRAAEVRAAIRDVTPQIGGYALSFEGALPEFEGLFFGPAKEHFSDDEFGEFMNQAGEAVKVAFLDILAADFVLRWGWTPIERFLGDADASGGLHPAAREYVEAWGRASMGLYEVQSVVPGKSLVLKDLLARRSVTVLERSASQSLHKWDAIFTRVVRMGDVGLLTGPVLEVPRRKLQWVIDALKKAKDRPGDKSVTWARFFKKHWDDIPYLWFLMCVSPFKGLTLQNFDGDELRDISVEYRLVVGGGGRASARLDAIEELNRNYDDAWTWSEERDRGRLENVSLAWVSLEGDSVVLRVNSREREARVCRRIDRSLGELVLQVERSDEAVDADSLQRGPRPADDGHDSEPIPMDVQRQVIHQMLAAHYRRWLDEPVPALDGLTPRQAVVKRSHRQRVVAILKNLEVESARRGSDDPATGFDFGWLWKELGLPRP